MSDHVPGCKPVSTFATKFPNSPVFVNFYFVTIEYFTPATIRDDVGAQPTESEEVLSTALGGDREHRGKRAAGGHGAAHYKSVLDDK